MILVPRLTAEECAALAGRAARADADARVGTSRREMARFRKRMEYAEMLALEHYDWDDLEPALYAI